MSYTYDGFGRISTQTTTNNGATVLTETFTYIPNSSQVSTYTTVAGGTTTTYTYTYDDNGNIATINDGTYTTTYHYDSANQLIREDNQAANTSCTWTYDSAGNITHFSQGEYTTGEPCDDFSAQYTYSDEQWGDVLVSYDTDYGNYSVTSDAIGNIISFLNNDSEEPAGWSYTWQHGRQLATLTDFDRTWEFTYNSDGLRTRRTDGTTTYNYIYNGSKLVQMTVDGHTLYFSYDAAGVPLSVNFDGVEYFYTTNLQGDVIGIVDSTGTTVVTYTYSAWGEPGWSDGTTNATLEALNPLRYRGYVYDEETNLYYLQSRYYNPQWGRFINADAFTTTGQGFTGGNMFVYCGNNPIIRIDATGEFFETIFEWLSDAWDGVISAADDIFGAGLVTVTTIYEKENQHTPFYSPVSIVTGTRRTVIVEETGNTTDPIAVYATHNLTNPAISSSAGLNVNVKDVTVNLNLALDNTSVNVKVKDGNVTDSFGIKADVSQVKVGFEYSTEIRTDNMVTTNYTNVSVNGMAFVYIYMLMVTGSTDYLPLYK